MNNIEKYHSGRKELRTILSHMCNLAGTVGIDDVMSGLAILNDVSGERLAYKGFTWRCDKKNSNKNALLRSILKEVQECVRISLWTPDETNSLFMYLFNTIFLTRFFKIFEDMDTKFIDENIFDTIDGLSITVMNGDTPNVSYSESMSYLENSMLQENETPCNISERNKKMRYDIIKTAVKHLNKDDDDDDYHL
jgi:hypothetical protein